jgi:hypothetical protein
MMGLPRPPDGAMGAPSFRGNDGEGRATGSPSQYVTIALNRTE